MFLEILKLIFGNIRIERKALAAADAHVIAAVDTVETVVEYPGLAVAECHGPVR